MESEYNNMKQNLGFGSLRLPLRDKFDITSIDYEMLNRLVDAFLEKGFVRFDTAYTYHGNNAEIALRKSLVERHERSEFELSTKMPMHLFNSRNDLERIFSEQLKNCGVDYFDRYLLHNLNIWMFKKAEEFNAFGFLAEKKAAGLIKQIGFSFHDSPKVLDDILTSHPEVDFVLLQINYLDWDDIGAQSRKCYEIARKHEKNIFVMEAVKGGNLARVPIAAEELMRAYNPTAEPSSWAMRFAGSLEGVETVLSGMNEMNQVLENTEVMRDFKPLNSDELDILKEVTKIINKETAVSCTGCKYCEEGCPNKIPIADYFALYNSAKRDSPKTSSASSSQFFYYLVRGAECGKASDCTECGECAKACPQHLPIPEIMKDVVEVFEKNPSFPSKR